MNSKQHHSNYSRCLLQVHLGKYAREGVVLDRWFVIFSWMCGVCKEWCGRYVWMVSTASCGKIKSSKRILTVWSGILFSNKFEFITKLFDQWSCQQQWSKNPRKLKFVNQVAFTADRDHCGWPQCISIQNAHTSFNNFNSNFAFIVCLCKTFVHNRHYVHSKCSPSRASLLTGRYAWTMGRWWSPLIGIFLIIMWYCDTFHHHHIS